MSEVYQICMFWVELGGLLPEICPSCYVMMHRGWQIRRPATQSSRRKLDPRARSSCFVPEQRQFRPANHGFRVHLRGSEAESISFILLSPCEPPFCQSKTWFRKRISPFWAVPGLRTTVLRFDRVVRIGTPVLRMTRDAKHLMDAHNDIVFQMNTSLRMIAVRIMAVDCMKC